MDKVKAQSILDAGAAKIKVLEDEMEKLTGKDNKKARNAKSREIADLKKEADYVDAERVLAGKEPLTERNKIATPKEETPKAENPAFVVKGGYAAPTALGAGKEKKKAKEGKDEGGGISAAELKELEKLKGDIIARKTELKAQGMSGGQQNKDEQIVAWVKRMNELKEKNGEATGKDAKKEKKKKSSGDMEAVENLKKEIESYKERLKTEYGYTKADINKDEDILAMTKRLKEMKG